jgi:aldehyde:ferredoxin oxidoreductase
MAPLGLFNSKLLMVDLTRWQVRVEPLDRRLVEQTMGGQGVNTRLAYDLIPAGADPLGPDNVLIFGAGAFTGTMVPGAGRMVVSGKSPLNNCYASSNSGTFATMLKFAGYDHLVVTGKSERPIYLKILDDDVTIEDASGLWGKDTYETTEALWQRYPQAWVTCIGPAGEKQVPYAVLISNKFSTNGSGGLGAVMGSKQLKAIVVHGTKGVAPAQAGRFMTESRRAMEDLMSAYYTLWWRELGTMIQIQDMAGPGTQARRNRASADLDRWTSIFRQQLRVREMTCPSCPVACKQVLQYPGKGEYFPVSCSIGTVTVPFVEHARIPLDNPEDILRCAETANRLGLSALAGHGGGPAVQNLIGMAMGLYERGEITKEQTGGLELRRGDASLVQRLLREMAYKEGFGSQLAQTGAGVVKALRLNPAKHFVHKGHYIGTKDGGTMFPGSKRWTVLPFGQIVDPRGDGPGTAYGSPTWRPGRNAASLHRYGLRIGIHERDINKVFTDERDGYDTPRLVHATELYNQVLYSLGMCQRSIICRALPIDRLATLYGAGTGLKVTPDELLEMAERTLTTQRLFNAREGLTKATEMPPHGYLAPEDERDLNRYLSEYYTLHGWDPATGNPTEEMMIRLDIAPAGQARISR